MDSNYQLILLNKNHIETLFNWNLEEKHFEYYTCRPLNLCKSFEEYTARILNSISEKKEIIYVLVKEEDCDTPIGKITLFDLNPRNHSAEFGYYLPENNRSKGFGGIMLSKFIDTIFKEDKLKLNKIYATTSSNNYPSIKLLEDHGFELEGRLREHYWIDDNKCEQLIYSILRRELLINNKSCIAN